MDQWLHPEGIINNLLFCFVIVLAYSVQDKRLFISFIPFNFEVLI
jgi:hypothetical protein